MSSLTTEQFATFPQSIFNELWPREAWPFWIVIAASHLAFSFPSLHD